MKQILILLLILTTFSCMEKKGGVITSKERHEGYYISRYKQSDLEITKEMYDTLVKLNPHEVYQYTSYKFTLNGDSSNTIYVDQIDYESNTEGILYQQK